MFHPQRNIYAIPLFFQTNIIFSLSSYIKGDVRPNVWAALLHTVATEIVIWSQMPLVFVCLDLRALEDLQFFFYS